MQIPKRKPGKYAHVKKDPHITKVKFDEIKKKLEKLKDSHPVAVEEVRRLAELGDFSENAAYQMAKGRLRGINQRILELEDQINYAVIIEPNKNSGVVQLGSTIIIDVNGREQSYQILGSSEASPVKGIISQNSPIGSALMGHRVGDEVELQHLPASATPKALQAGKNKIIKCKIIKIK